MTTDEALLYPRLHLGPFRTRRLIAPFFRVPLDLIQHLLYPFVKSLGRREHTLAVHLLQEVDCLFADLAVRPVTADSLLVGMDHPARLAEILGASSRRQDRVLFADGRELVHHSRLAGEKGTAGHSDKRVAWPEGCYGMMVLVEDLAYYRNDRLSFPNGEREGW